MSLDTADRGGIPAFLDKRKLVYTFTNLQAYKNCPHAMYRRYIARDIPYVETPEMKYGNDVHSALELRVGAGKPLPEGMQQWEPFAVPFDPMREHVKCEQKLGCTSAGVVTDFWSPTVWFRGKIDLQAIKGDKAVIFDWKTGNSKYESPFELECAAVLLKLSYQNLKQVVGRYVWLKENRLGQQYDLSDFRKTWDEIQRLASLIESDREADEFRKQKSGLCGYCGVKDCENYREVGR